MLPLDGCASGTLVRRRWTARGRHAPGGVERDVRAMRDAASTRGDARRWHERASTVARVAGARRGDGGTPEPGTGASSQAPRRDTLPGGTRVAWRFVELGHLHEDDVVAEGVGARVHREEAVVAHDRDRPAPSRAAARASPASRRASSCPRTPSPCRAWSARSILIFGGSGFGGRAAAPVAASAPPARPTGASAASSAPACLVGGALLLSASALVLVAAARRASRAHSRQQQRHQHHQRTRLMARRLPRATRACPSATAAAPADRRTPGFGT